ncbi:GGDEF domain-containing protein [Paractinoplanes durhamensis]|uniref:GGDEF domain-containing protein n=1 Tax=Paractinoplanes durhamensis TaxID=113563 RepID=UPI001943D323|nr:GGDEF domain-containing protein [Actinoplanes durhamensis]
MTEEVSRLRSELAASRAASTRALARATRLAQLVSALGQRTDVTDILERAVCEVAEQFGADIVAVFTPARDGVLTAAQWGFAARDLPAGALTHLAPTGQLSAAAPVKAGPIADFVLPPWLLASRPRHVAWSLLTAREEHLGYLLLLRRGDTPFESAEVQELASVGSRIALAVDNARLYVRSQEQLRRLQQLHNATAALAVVVDVDQAVRDIAEMLVAAGPVEGAAIYLTGPEGDVLAARAGTIDDCPSVLEADEPVELPDTMLFDLGIDGSSLGRLLLIGAHADTVEQRSFLEHLADVGALVLERATLFARIRAQAETDVLTSLPNRWLFMDRLSAAVARCRQHSTDLAVFFIDLDGFKQINDRYGHDAGDQLLVQTAQRLSGSVGAAATTARLGGDEFVVLLEGCTADHAEAYVAPNIQRALDTPSRLQLVDGVVQVRGGGSIGIGTAEATGYDVSALMRAADAAMYAAKQARRRLSLAAG